MVVSPESVQRLIHLLPELHLCTMSVRISREPGDGPPIVTQNTQVVHRPPVFIHTSAKDFDALSFIEFAVQVMGHSAGESLEIRMVHIRDALASSKSANRLPSDRPEEISFEELNGLAVAQNAGRCVHCSLKNPGR